MASPRSRRPGGSSRRKRVPLVRRAGDCSEKTLRRPARGRVEHGRRPCSRASPATSRSTPPRTIRRNNPNRERRVRPPLGREQRLRRRRLGHPPRRPEAPREPRDGARIPVDRQPRAARGRRTRARVRASDDERGRKKTPRSRVRPARPPRPAECRVSGTTALALARDPDPAALTRRRPPARAWTTSGWRRWRRPIGSDRDGSSRTCGARSHFLLAYPLCTAALYHLLVVCENASPRRPLTAPEKEQARARSAPL